jgi:hypothetical protein
MLRTCTECQQLRNRNGPGLRKKKKSKTICIEPLQTDNLGNFRKNLLLRMSMVQYGRIGDGEEMTISGPLVPYCIVQAENHQNHYRQTVADGTDNPSYRYPSIHPTQFPTAHSPSSFSLALGFCLSRLENRPGSPPAWRRERRGGRLAN